MMPLLFFPAILKTGNMKDREKTVWMMNENEIST